MTVFEKMRNKRIPDYYHGMWLDGYQPWEIMEAAHKSFIERYEKEREAPATQSVKIQMEVIRK